MNYYHLKIYHIFISYYRQINYFIPIVVVIIIIVHLINSIKPIIIINYSQTHLLYLM